MNFVDFIEAFVREKMTDAFVTYGGQICTGQDKKSLTTAVIVKRYWNFLKENRNNCSFTILNEVPIYYIRAELIEVEIMERTQSEHVS
jgi:hypothetical protein